MATQDPPASPAGFLTWDASSKQRFLVGGVGACLPLLVQLIALDGHAGLNEANLFGVGVRYVVLFFLGGMLAYFHSDEVKPIKLLEIGVAAPALITVAITGNAVKPSEPVVPSPVAQHRAVSDERSFFISSAHAQPSQRVQATARPIGDVLSDVVDGITGKAYRGAAPAATAFPPDPGWIAAADGTLPSSLSAAGHEAAPSGKPLYICRAFVNNGLHPGKIRADFHGCNVGWGGREYSSPTYQVLARTDLTWARGARGSVPGNAVPAGEESAPGREPLFICRADYKGGVHPGKVRRSFGGCNIGWGGKEEVVSSYEVLVN